MFLEIIVILLLIYVWFLGKFSFWEKRGFLTVPGKIPFGSVPEMNNTVHTSELFKRIYDDFKGKSPIVGLYLMTRPVLLITDPELVKNILVTDFDSFYDHGFYSNEDDNLISNMLFFLSGQRWKHLRSKLTKLFTNGKIKLYFDSIAVIGDRMIDHLKQVSCVGQGVDIEIKNVFESYTIEVIACVAFGLDINCLDNQENEFRKITESVFNPPKWEGLKFMFMNSFKSISNSLKLRVFNKKKTEFFTAIVKGNIEYREAKNFKRNDFLQFVIPQKNQKNGLTMDEIIGSCFTFLLAG